MHDARRMSTCKSPLISPCWSHSFAPCRLAPPCQSPCAMVPSSMPSGVSTQSPYPSPRSSPCSLPVSMPVPMHVSMMMAWPLQTIMMSMAMRMVGSEETHRRFESKVLGQAFDDAVRDCHRRIPGMRCYTGEGRSHSYKQFVVHSTGWIRRRMRGQVGLRSVGRAACALLFHLWSNCLCNG